MLRIIALLTLILSTFGKKYYKIGSITSFILYTISLFCNDLNFTYNWLALFQECSLQNLLPEQVYSTMYLQHGLSNFNNISFVPFQDPVSFSFNIHFGKLETLMCSIVCLILTILHYSADILYKNDNKTDTILYKYFTNIKSILIRNFNRIKYYLNNYFNQNKSISYPNNSHNKVILIQNYTNTNLILHKNYCINEAKSYKDHNKTKSVLYKYYNRIKAIFRGILNIMCHIYNKILYKKCTNTNLILHKNYCINEAKLYKNHNKTKSVLCKYYIRTKEIFSGLLTRLYEKKFSINLIKWHYKRHVGPILNNYYSNQITIKQSNSANMEISNNIKQTNILKLLNIFSFAMCFAICSNSIWQFYISIELLGLISSVFVGIEKCNKQATVVYVYNKFASIIFLFGTILYLINHPKYNELSIICFIVACLCKSAQLPFSNWLIIATHANTLASILIHCATIIGVGIIFIYKFHYLLEQYSYLSQIILAISLLTSIIYPIVALYETNIKKIIACLTISSTGTMFTLCALKQYSISINYFLCHAFFKSLLFLVFAYYIDYFKTKDIRQFYNLKYLNTVGLIALFSCIGVPPFIGFFPKLLINEAIDLRIIKLFVEISNCLMNIVIFKLYLQYLKANKNSISEKFNIKPISVLIICSIIYGFTILYCIAGKDIYQDTNINSIVNIVQNISQYTINDLLNNIYRDTLENAIVIFIAYIIAKYTKEIPFNKINKVYVVIQNIKHLKKINIPKYTNKFNNKIEQFYSIILYNYPYKLAAILDTANNSNYKNQTKYLVIGIVIICIALLF